MGILVRAIITGFGLSLGKFIFDKTKERVLGVDYDTAGGVVIDADEVAAGSDDE